MNDENKIPEWAPALEDLKLGSRVRWNESLKRFNTWRIGGPSRGLVDVETEEDLARLLPFLNKNDIPWFLIGKGSNLLIHDRIWEGVILHLTGILKAGSPKSIRKPSVPEQHWLMSLLHNDALVRGGPGWNS